MHIQLLQLVSRNSPQPGMTKCLIKGPVLSTKLNVIYAWLNYCTMRNRAGRILEPPLKKHSSVGVEDIVN